MGNFKHRHEERLSPQQAAERLIDIAYALTAGDSLELGGSGRRVTVRIPSELTLERELTSDGGRVGLELDLTWRAADD